MSVEEMVREVLAACDPGVIEAVARGINPMTLTTGDLVEAANRLAKLLQEDRTRARKNPAG